MREQLEADVDGAIAAPRRSCIVKVVEEGEGWVAVLLPVAFPLLFELLFIIVAVQRKFMIQRRTDEGEFHCFSRCK